MDNNDQVVPLQPGPNASRYSVASLLATEFPPNRWWIPGFLPKGGIALMGGQKKIGKSWVNNNMCHALVSGGTFLPEEPGYGEPYNGPEDDPWKSPQAEQCRVLLVDMELGAMTLKERTASIFAHDLAVDPEGTHRILSEQFFYLTRPQHGESAVSLTNSAGLTRLVEACKECAPNVLIIDPLNMAHGYDEDSNTEIQAMFSKLQELQDKVLVGLNSTILVAHHFRKPPTTHLKDHDPLDINNFRGASKYADVADSIIAMDVLRTAPDNSRRAWNLHMRVTGRHGPGSPRLQVGVNFLGDGRIYFRKVLD